MITLKLSPLFHAAMPWSAAAAKFFPWLAAIFLSFLYISSAVATSAPSRGSWPSSPLYRKIIVLDNAKKKITDEMNQRPVYSSDDYHRYISYLQGRITELCSLAVNRHGSDAVASLPCPPVERLLPGYQVPAASSREEQVDSAHMELLESLGRFDEFLDREQQRVMAERPQEAGSAAGEAVSDSGGSGSGGGSGGAYGGSGNSGMNSEGHEGQHGGRQGGEGIRSAQGSESGQQGSRQGEMSGGKPGVSGENRPQGMQGQAHEGTAATGQRGSGGIAGTGMQGSPDEDKNSSIYEDDDIVARQLREAAERETDPELKKKLWEEYRKYKEANH